MPLLKREIDLLPPEIFSLPPDLYPWGLAHVRSRQEKVMARYLVAHGIPFYLPTAEVRHRRGSRTRVSHLPLFPGYVFHRAPSERRDLIWRSEVAANLIEVAGQVQLGAELEQLRRLQEAGAVLSIHPAFVPGEAVRIMEGAFAGYSGIVLRTRGQNRLIVHVSLLKQAVAVEFDRSVLATDHRPGA